MTFYILPLSFIIFEVIVGPAIYSHIDTVPT